MADPPQTVRDLRRAQIVGAARALVAEGGVGALTIGALEGRLAFSRGVITYHFDNKDEIVLAVLQSAVEEIDAAVYARAGAADTPEAQVRAVLEATVGGFTSHPEAGAILMSFWGRLHADPRVRDVNARLFERYRSASARLVEWGKQAGTFRGDASTDGLAAVMVGAVIGITAQVYFAAGAIDQQAAVDEAAEAVLARLRSAHARRARGRAASRRG